MEMSPLTTRTDKGAALSWEEMDGNLAEIERFANALADLVATSLNDDGTIKNNAVTEASVLSRAIARRALSVTALPFVVDTGSANDYRVTMTPTLQLYENEMVFFMRVGHMNTESSTLRIGDLDPLPILKQGNLELESGDLRQGAVVCLAFYNSAFHLIAGSGSSSSSGGVSGANFTGLAKSDSGDTAWLAANASRSYAHGFNGIPSLIELWAVCSTDSNGYTMGARIPLGTLKDPDGAQAFAVTATATEVTVKRTSAATTVYDAAGTALTDANWSIRVESSITHSESTNLFPALSVSIHKPEGAISWGNNIFITSYGTHQGKSNLIRLDMGTNQLYPLDAASDSSNPRYLNFAPFRLLDGEDYAIATSNTGVFKLKLTDPGGTWQLVELFSAAVHPYKPAHYDEAGNELLAVYSQRAAVTIASISVTRVTPGGANAYGTAINLTNANIQNRDEFMKWYAGTGNASLVTMFQYNPIKGRIYVMTDEVYGIHIFEIQGTKNFKTWYDQTPVDTRAGNLKYLKTLALGGDGDEQVDADSEHVTVEFDLGTGQEKAVVFTRPGNTSKAGSVTRVPWREVV